MDQEIKKKLACPVCSSTNVLTNRKTKKRWCRRCGNEWPKEKK